MPAVTYTLSIDGVPASQELLQAIQQIEVEDHANMADMLRLQVVIGVKDGCAGWSFVDDDGIQPAGQHPHRGGRGQRPGRDAHQRLRHRDQRHLRQSAGIIDPERGGDGSRRS